MTKFTKGKWQVLDKLQVSGVKVSNLIQMVGSKPTNHAANIYAIMGGFDISTQREEVEATAHLIASAPAMYKLLQKIAKDNFFTREIEDLLNVARGNDNDTATTK